MIESKIIEKSEMKETFPYIDIFSRPKIHSIYKFFYIILRHKTHNSLLLFFIRILFFVQLMQHSVIGGDTQKIKNDFFINILYSIRYFVFPHLCINSKKNYIILLSSAFFYSFLLIILLFYLKINYLKKFNVYLIQFLGFLHCLLVNYLICPLINILGIIIICKNNKHIYLDLECYSDSIHLFLLIISLINFIFLIFYSFTITIHFNEIGGIKTVGTLKRTNTYFELICFSLSLIIYFLGFIQNYYYGHSKSMRIYVKIIHIIYGFILYFYLNNNVYFYNHYINLLMTNGFLWFSWLSFILLMTFFTTIVDVVVFIIIGWTFIFIFLYFFQLYKIEYYLFQSNIFECENLKNIEIFIYNFNSLIQNNNHDSKIFIHGIINSFEDYLINHKEEEELYQSLIYNKYMKKYFGKNSVLLKMNSIIYTIYRYFMEKSANLKDDILILFCYFLVNNIKNPTYTIYLCSKKKIGGYKNNFLKFTLMQDIKEYMKDRLLQNNFKNKDSIKHIEITKVILFNKYSEKLRIKIFDATQAQADYFNFLRSSSENSTEKFLNIGNKILLLRKEILNLWNEIINLNPFCDEIEQDFIMYLDNIIQDDDLLNKLSKNFHMIKEKKIIEKDNKYHQLFNMEKSCILLFDGFNNKGKLLYYTVNFPRIFFINNEKQLLNLYLEDLVPKCLSNFHDKLIQDSIEYSNLKNVFKEEKNIPIQIKDTLFNVNGYIKSLPSFSSGLIFIVALTKENSNQFLLFLDSEFKIDSMTNISINEFEFKKNQNNFWIYPYNLRPSIIGNHISTLIPEFLQLIEYKKQKYIIQNEITEYRGNIFSNVITTVSIKTKLEKIYEHIKINGKLKTFSNDNFHYLYNFFNDINKKETIVKNTQTFKNAEKENNDLILFNDFFNEIKNTCDEKSNSIYFRVFHCSYFNNQYSFYKVFIQKDITIDLNIQDLNNNKNKKKKLYETHFEEEVPKVLRIKTKDYKRQITKIDSKNKLKEDSKKKINNHHHIKLKRYLTNIGQNNSNFLQNQISYNLIKQYVLNKKTPQNVNYLRISTFIFSLFSLLIIIYNTKSLKNNFLNIDEFLRQNYFFNETKQNTASLFISFYNFQLTKKGFLTEEIFNENYFNNTLIMIKTIIDDLLIEINEVGIFKEEYNNIISHLQLIDYYVLNLNNIITYDIDKINVLYFLISNSLNFINKTHKYFNEKNESLEFLLTNIIESSFNYSFSNLNGLSYEQIKEIINNKKSYSINLIYIIFHVLLFIVFFLFFVYLISKRYKAKKRLIEKMVNFQTKEFDHYIKYLEEIRKKLNNDIEEEKKDSENDINEKNNNKKNNDEEEKTSLEKKRKNWVKSNLNNTVKDIKIKKETKEREKEKRKKLHIIQIQKKQKKNIIIKYYIFLELFSSIKYCGILILFMIFYTIIYPVYIIKRNDYLSFDNLSSKIESVTINTYLKYINIKKDIITYIIFIKEKEKCLKILKSNEICLLNNQNVTLLNISNINFDYSIFKDDDPYIEDNTLYLKLIKKINSNIKSPEGELAKLYYGNMCELLIKFNTNINYKHCSTFWNSILIQGLQQSLVYQNNLNKQVLSLFSQSQYDNDTFDLNLFNSALLILCDIETYLLNYFYFGEKYSNLLLLKIKKIKRNKIINS